MQSSIAILLRAGILLGCLAALPMMAAGGVGGVDKFLAEANSWWQRQQAEGVVTVPRTIQVELPAEALQYRDFAPFTDSSRAVPIHESDAPGLSRQFSEEPLLQEHPLNQQRLGSAEDYTGPEIQLVSNSASSRDSGFFSQNSAENFDQSGAERFPSRSVGNQSNANQIGQILRDCGAIEVKLEPWGNSGNLYRYQAIMAMGGLGDVQRHFQAVHSDPDLAAQEVLQQVKSWRQ